MNEHARTSLRKRLETTKKNLERNRMAAYIAETKEDAREIVRTLLPKGGTVATGGSQSLIECGVMDLLSCGDYTFWDRASFDDPNEAFRKAFSADAYLCSSNAVTESGELYNVDGNSNRVAAIAYGPESVILVVGCNKVVHTMEAAVTRVKTHAAPPNCVRLQCETYCKETGSCAGIDGAMTDGCHGDGRICCSYLVSAQQRKKDRIKVILVMEELGF